MKAALRVQSPAPCPKLLLDESNILLATRDSWIQLLGDHLINANCHCFASCSLNIPGISFSLSEPYASQQPHGRQRKPFTFARGFYISGRALGALPPFLSFSWCILQKEIVEELKCLYLSGTHVYVCVFAYVWVHMSVTDLCGRKKLYLKRYVCVLLFGQLTLERMDSWSLIFFLGISCFEKKWLKPWYLPKVSWRKIGS